MNEPIVRRHPDGIQIDKVGKMADKSIDISIDHVPQISKVSSDGINKGSTTDSLKNMLDLSRRQKIAAAVKQELSAMPASDKS